MKTCAEVKEDYFSRGLAVCEPRILTDTIYFRFRDEEFEFPSNECHHLITYNAANYNTAPVAKLRKLKKSMRVKDG